MTELPKHIDISYHYVRDLYENKRIDVKYVPTDQMAADGLSKPLPKQLFKNFMRQIGMTLIGQSGRIAKKGNLISQDDD